MMGYTLTIHDLIQKLRQSGRVSVGVWFLPAEYIGKEVDIAARLNLAPLDAREAYLDWLPEGTRFSGLTTPNGDYKLLDFLRYFGRNIYARDCLLIYTFDLLLLGLEVDKRQRFWPAALSLPYLRTKLVITLVEDASFLLNDLCRFSDQIAWGNL